MHAFPAVVTLYASPESLSAFVPKPLPSTPLSIQNYLITYDHVPRSLLVCHLLTSPASDVASSQAPHSPAVPDGPPRVSLAPASIALMNSRLNGTSFHQDNKPLPSVPSAIGPGPRMPQGASNTAPRRRSTIRAVPNLEDQNRSPTDDSLSSDTSPSPVALSASTFSVLVDSNASPASLLSLPLPNGTPNPTGRRKVSPATVTMFSNNTASTASSRGQNRPSVMDIPHRESSLGGSARPPAGTTAVFPGATKYGSITTETAYDTDRQAEDAISNPGFGAADVQVSHGWDSTVGKAGLGKTGRVINRLVSDNEALKRDLRLERLKADESRQAARLLEDRMERMVSDYESRLLEASVTKTLLSRKERQVESLQVTLELERGRAAEARDKERTWRNEVERVRSDTKRQVEEATGHAALMEGRYNAISSHWRDQGDEVRKAMTRMDVEIRGLLKERQRDDDRITLLRDLCDQQDGNIKDLCRQKDDISRQFDEYRDEQEGALRNIKSEAAEREAQQGRTLEEAREVLDKLRWALHIKSEVEWAG